MHRSILIPATVALLVVTSACTAGANPSPAASPSGGSQASPSAATASPAASPSEDSQPSSSPWSCVSGDDMITEDARGEQGDLVPLAQGAVGGVEAGDVFEVIDDQSRVTIVRIARDGQEIGTLSYSQDPEGGWLLSQWNLCAGLWVAGAPAWCVLGACGRATIDPLAAPVGALVRIEADNGYFGIWTPEQWAEWCGELLIALHRDDDKAPAPGTLAPLTLVDAKTATFQVPELAEGVYYPALSCSGDEAFAWPTLPVEFTVLSGG